MCIGTAETTTFTVACGGGNNIPSEKNMARGLDVELLDEALFDYHYNTVLLLIEKQESSSMFDRLRQELSETEIVLKQEQLSYLIALSEVKENLRNALYTEQCETNLERSLCELQEELARVQSSSHTKLDEANALVDGIEEKSSTVNKKLLDAEAKLDDVNRKNEELDMKLREMEVRESLLQKEHLSVATDRESFETEFYKQREDLKECERKLQEREDMLCDLSQNLGEREKNVIETEKNLKQKGRDLEVLENNIDSANSLLKEKEADIIRRVADVDAEEKKVDSVKRMLELKEKELHALELKLSTREREGIQKLLDEQMDTLVLKLQQFELEMEQMRKERNKELETKLESLKEKENAMEIKEKRLEKEKEQLLADRDSFESLNVELGKIKTEISQQELRICQETENLKLTQDERSEHSRLQLELKQEIEHSTTQKNFIMKEAENLRVEKLRFEKEWEELEKKRAEISRERQKIEKEKKRLRKLKNNEEKRLKRKKQTGKVKNEKTQVLRDFEWKTVNFENEIQKRMQKMEKDLHEREREFQEEMERQLNIINILKDATEKEREEVNSEEIRLEIERTELETNKQQLKSELEMLELDKESIKHEPFLCPEMVKFVKAQMSQRFEEMEKDLQERERKFQEEMERELDNINILKDDTEKEWEEVKYERTRLENERNKHETKKQQLKSDQREMQEDSEMLINLSQKVNNERERLVAERNHFLALVEKLRNCRNCGEVVRDIVVSDFFLPSSKERGMFPLPTSSFLNDTHLKNSKDNVISSGSNYYGSTTTKVDSVGTSYMAGTLPESDVNVNIVKVEEPASSPNIEGPTVTLQEVQVVGGMDLNTSEAPHLQSVAIVREAKEVCGKTSKEVENVSLQSLNTDHIKESSQEEPSHTEKVIGDSTRKRRHAQTSKIAEGGQNTANSDSERHSDSITTGGHKKKRKTVYMGEVIQSQAV